MPYPSERTSAPGMVQQLIKDCPQSVARVKGKVVDNFILFERSDAKEKGNLLPSRFI
jgi:hypothetical protein